MGHNKEISIKRPLDINQDTELPKVKVSKNNFSDTLKTGPAIYVNNSKTDPARSISQQDKTLLELAKKHNFQNNYPFKEVRQLLKQDKYDDINARDEEGNSLLDYAIYGNNISLAEELIARNADPNPHLPDQDSAMSNALSLQANNIDMVNLLHKHGADINCKDSLGDNALHQVATSGDVQKMRLVLSQEFSQKLINEKGETVRATPLELAVSTSKIENINLLIKNGAQVTHQCLYSAVSNNSSLGIFNLLWNNSSQEVQSEARSDNSFLCVVARNTADNADPTKLKELTERLVELGLPSAATEDGQTMEEAYFEQYIRNNGQHDEDF